MSHTLNNITMLVALSEATKDSVSMQKYILANAEYMKSKGRPFKEYPELFTESLVSEQLHVLRKSGMAEQVGKKIHNTPVIEDLEYSGINTELLSRTEFREMQVAKLFINEFRHDISFRDVVWNAKDHINSHLKSEKYQDHAKDSGRHLPASILYSACLGNGGRGVGMHEPDEYHLSNAMSKNKQVQRLFERLIDANAAYYESHGLGEKLQEAWLNLAERVKGVREDIRHDSGSAVIKGVGALAVAVCISAAINMDRGPSSPEAHASNLSYAPNNVSYSVVVPVNDGDTASQIVKNALTAIEIEPSRENIASMLEENNLGDDLYRGTLVSVKLPDVMLNEKHFYNLSKEGMSVKYSGQQAIAAVAQNKFVENLEEKRSNEQEGPSM